jgi:peptide-methionine (R)-S-oxide reductase
MSESFSFPENPKTLTNADWQIRLTPEQYAITRKKGTEHPFTGQYNTVKEAGTFVCVCCGANLFNSTAKYDSGSGWPSFWQAITPQSISNQTDLQHGMQRVEITCAQCDAHLGHVFPDGPEPTGLRYCVNSASLLLKKT